ncbi:hypothetical protein NJ56_11400 [Yersinia ruckeri]|nr:hypothetical protein NJ56_11400 [Yersinia ruckeri]PHZ19169.1 hypothetical protein CS534_12175 [Yersinia ruckeri]
MLYRRNLCPQTKQLHNDNAPSLYGGRAFCLKIHVNNMVVFTSTTLTVSRHCLLNSLINSLIHYL